jgi:hypothetical protein
MRAAPLVVLPLVLLIAACSGGPSPSASSPTAPVTVAATPNGRRGGNPDSLGEPGHKPGRLGTHVPHQPVVSAMGQGRGSRRNCLPADRVHQQGAQHMCPAWLSGGAFVAPATGRQVGAVASPNPQVPVTTILIAPDSSVSALLGIANYQNFPAGECLSHPVSGLRIYPPGNTAAAHVPFKTASAACSTQVGQLSVAAVVTGTTGQ